MKKFFFKLIKLSFGVLILVGLTLYGLDVYWNKKSPINTLFIWGDSQTQQGIDLKTLKQNSNKTIFSAARHGAGMYDFLVFCSKVPNNSVVIIGPSIPMFLREKEKDRNIAGMSLKALYLMYANNYSTFEIANMVTKNTKPLNFFETTSELYSGKDIETIDWQIEAFKKAIKVQPDHFKSKVKIFKKGIDWLEEKGCTINYISFPLNQEIKNMVDKSFLKNTQRELLSKNNQTIVVEELEESQELMFDATHLNEHGAKIVTEKIAEKINDKTTFSLDFELK